MKDYLGKIVEVIIDRPLGTKHPKNDIVYELNYGFIPNTKSGDGEEIDVYVLGINEPILKTKGKVIAVINRLNDVEDKLVVAPIECKQKFTKEQIKELTYFQEKYFKIEILTLD